MSEVDIANFAFDHNIFSLDIEIFISEREEREKVI